MAQVKGGPAEFLGSGRPGKEPYNTPLKGMGGHIQQTPQNQDNAEYLCKIIPGTLIPRT